MEPKMKQDSGRDKQQHVRRGVDILAEDEENADIEEILAKQNTFSDRIAQVMEKIASKRLGQIVFEKTDRALKVLEETAKWSLPPDEHQIELQRPLPWILFIGLIVWLRVFRVCFAVVANIVGLQPFTPKSMVYYLQTQRRHLRAIRVQGLKMLRSKETEAIDKTSTKEGSSLMANLRTVLNSAICKPGQRREAPATRHVFKQDGKDNTDDMAKRSNKRPRHEESDLGDLTVAEMLDKFASADSDNDSDYVPPENDDDDYDNSTTSHNTTASAEEAEKYLEEKSTKSTNHNLKEIDTNTEEVKENGAMGNHSKVIKPVDENAHENHNNKVADGMEPIMYTTKNDLNEPVENGETKLMPWPRLEAASLTSENAHIPKSLYNFLAAAQLDDSTKTSTSAQENPAFLTSSSSSKAVETEKKSYRTKTTQTAIELDWTISVKTEITHKKHYPKLERLNYSVDITPASSSEDIFYSPMGSLQDFHAIFHPVPTENGSSDAAKTSTPKEAASDDGASSCSPENQGPNQKKTFYHSSRNRHHTHHYYNAKNRNKNRH